VELAQEAAEKLEGVREIDLVNAEIELTGAASTSPARWDRSEISTGRQRLRVKRSARSGPLSGVLIGSPSAASAARSRSRRAWAPADAGRSEREMASRVPGVASERRAASNVARAGRLR
jgi:hypothetical protein